MEIQQQRPTQEEFMDAAVRYETNAYTDSLYSSLSIRALIVVGRALAFMPTPNVESPPRYSKKVDQKLIERERAAEGYVIGEEDIIVFTRRQLDRYTSNW